MSVQQFCLRWNNHQPNFISVFSNLLLNESLVDVTLAAEGRHLQAHKVVLSACSSYFQSLFTINPCQHPIVILKDVKYNDLKTMVDFMYYGEVNVSQEQLPHILKTAEMLKIKGLAEMPDSTSLTKSQSTSSDRAEILTPGDSTWGSDPHRHTPSPSPMSPNSRRKRLRKSSTGSGSLSTERNSEEHQHSIDITSPTIIKPEPTPYIASSLSSMRNSKQETSTESETPLESSQESLDEDQPPQLGTHKPDNESNISVVQSMGTNVVEMAGPSVSASCSQSTQHPGLQWTLVEHSYPRFALSSCQTSMDGTTPTAPPTSQAVPMQYSTPSYPSQVISVNSCAVVGNYQNNESDHNNTSPQIMGSPGVTNYHPSPCPSPSSQQVTTNNTPRPKRSKNPQAEENFVRAIEAVRFGGIGFCKAARMYGVNNRTLWLEFKKRGYPNTRPSIKNRVKLENLSPPPPPAPVSQPEEYATPSPTVSMPTSEAGSVMCPPHPMGMMGFLDTRHVEFSPGMHAMSRQRFPDGPVNMNPSPINLHGVNYNTM